MSRTFLGVEYRIEQKKNFLHGSGLLLLEFVVFKIKLKRDKSLSLVY